VPTCSPAAQIAQATGGTEPNVVIAALLRDANQDQGMTAETIAIEEKCREAKLLKLADKVATCERYKFCA
jgi:hypothetical protein